VSPSLIHFAAGATGGCWRNIQRFHVHNGVHLTISSVYEQYNLYFPKWKFLLKPSGAFRKAGHLAGLIFFVVETKQALLALVLWASTSTILI